MAFKIFSKFYFLAALLVIKRLTIMTTPKIPTIKPFTPISLMALCISSLVAAFATASSVVPVTTIKRLHKEKWLVSALQVKFITS